VCTQLSNSGRTEIRLRFSELLVLQHYRPLDLILTQVCQFTSFSFNIIIHFNQSQYRDKAVGTPFSYGPRFLPAKPILTDVFLRFPQFLHTIAAV